MLSVAVICLAVFQLGTSVVAYDYNNEDYFWKEYTGIIPQEAIPGGKDMADRPTYIGQIFSKSYGLLPATITVGSMTAEASASIKVTADNYVKILCSRNQESYTWITTKTDQVHLLGTRCQLVIGGTDTINMYYIGRAYHERQVIIGKVNLYSASVYKGLTILYNSKEHKYDYFEILAYNCQEGDLGSVDLTDLIPLGNGTGSEVVPQTETDLENAVDN